MTGLEIAEEREKDASRQRRRDEREAAALAAADVRLEAKEKERKEEQEILVANWIADTQLRSQISYADVETDEDQQPRDPGQVVDPLPVALEECLTSLDVNSSLSISHPTNPTRSLLMVDRVDLEGSRSHLGLCNPSKRRSNWDTYLQSQS
jgi:monoamine oxidase